MDKLTLAKENIESLTGKTVNAALFFEELPKADGPDRYEIHPLDGGFLVKATSVPALSVALTKILSGSSEAVSVAASFRDSGVMLDCSRNAVVTVETAKKLIRLSSAMGLNFLMLYTEDTYEIPEEPAFGYMRGRFSLDELLELDAFAGDYGVELVPCIQTLAHLKTFLRWNGADFRDTEDILLAGDDKTYAFIENALKAVRSAFSSKRVHIGMDEAHMLGRGAYLDKNGYRNGFDILLTHLKRVTELSKKYGFQPMIWSDMFFKLGSKTHVYYDPEVAFTDEIRAMIPDVSLVYWDYYHESTEMYDKMFENHLLLEKPVVFAGGLSSWYGHLPRFEAAYNTTIAGLRSAKAHAIDTVFATLWGDDGNECNLRFVQPYLTLFSAFTWGNGTMADIQNLLRLFFGYGFQTLVDLGLMDFCPEEPKENNPSREITPSGATMKYFRGKRLFYTDLFYELGVDRTYLTKAIDLYERTRADLEKAEMLFSENASSHPAFSDGLSCIRFASAFYRTLVDKSNLLLMLRDAYQKSKSTDENEQEDARGLLTFLSDEFFPALCADYEDLAQKHRSMWLETYKPFGYETLSLRYGGLLQRLKDQRQTVSDYVSGKVSSIPELEEPVLPVHITKHNTFDSLTKPGI